jgi:hypothetical protein
MTPVYQTRFSRDGDKGNCWAACLASVVGCRLSEVPDTRERDKGAWFDITADWLRTLGLSIECHHDVPKGWAIACGDSVRGDWLHSVIVWDGKMIHDPHPEGSGIKGQAKFYFVIQSIPVVKA